MKALPSVAGGNKTSKDPDLQIPSFQPLGSLEQMLLTKQQEDQQRQQREQQRKIIEGKEADLDPATCLMQVVEIGPRSSLTSFISNVSIEDATTALKLLVPFSLSGEDIHEVFSVRIKTFIDSALQAGAVTSFVNKLILCHLCSRINVSVALFALQVPQKNFQLCALLW